MTRAWQAVCASVVLTVLWTVATPARAYQWLEAESPHFHVLARGTQARLEQRVQRLERLHHAMLLALGAAEGQTLSRPPFQMVMKDETAS